MTDSIHTPGDEVTEPRRDAALTAAIALLEGALLLRMYGERPPGAPRDDSTAETWPRWVRDVEVFLRSNPESEGPRLREALEKIAEKHQRSSDSWYPDRQFPTEAARHWHDGFITGLATCSIVAHEALNTEQAEKDDAGWLAASGTDREWFELTGNCGHCGNHAPDCVCTEGDPCGCGPHEPRTWPIACYRCKGTGMVDPVRGRGHSDGQMSLLVPSDTPSPLPASEVER